MTYRLDNCVLRNKQHPDTFEIPSKERIRALKPGEYVKLIFLGGQGAERMWVSITKIAGDKFTGKLANTPLQPGAVGVTYGATIRFNSRHIAATE